ncbi:MAG: ATP-binding cassette domain-containing protein [Tannerellaceae bacterium]|jgi:zinc transport system ATP-binding protein|nr:ATP-binding cassette domain-containing protein [Tannerellaceae bacterium]
MNDRIIEVENVGASYPGRNGAVLSNVSFTLNERDFLGITGPNGGGKTTLLKLILGLIKPTAGRIRFFEGGRETKAIKLGYLPQMNMIDKKFPISVKEVISSGLTAEKPLLRTFTKAQKERIEEVVVEMGLEELADCAIGRISGGQLQRTLLGRAVINKPRALILDEPASYIDKAFEDKFYRMLETIRTESALILVSHNMQPIEGALSRLLYVDGTVSDVIH